MAYTQQTWQDGVTPVDAERMNHIEGGVSDLSDQVDELNSINFVISGTTNRTVTVVTNNINASTSRTYEYTTGIVVIACISTSCYGIYMATAGIGPITLVSAGNYISVSRDSATLTIENTNTGSGIRAIAFCW